MDYDDRFDDERDYTPSQAICDSDCRCANHCGGRVCCSSCGKVVCECETDADGECPECSESHHTCENCGEDFHEDDGGVEREGYWFCSDECADDFFSEDTPDTTSDAEGGL